MTLVPFQPLRELASFQDEVSRLFGGAGTASHRRALGDTAVWLPALDVRESDTALILTLDVPGVAKDDIAIELDAGELTVSGERVRESRDVDEQYRRAERRFGSFSRTLVLPEAVDESTIVADYSDGVLTVTIAKPEESKPRRIEISGS
ncbi:MAG: Hsp20/alpha crystallin family protein [Gaiellales bacterium]